MHFSGTWSILESPRQTTASSPENTAPASSEYEETGQAARQGQNIWMGQMVWAMPHDRFCPWEGEDHFSEEENSHGETVGMAPC